MINVTLTGLTKLKYFLFPQEILWQIKKQGKSLSFQRSYIFFVSAQYIFFYIQFLIEMIRPAQHTSIRPSIATRGRTSREIDE